MLLAEALECAGKASAEIGHASVYAANLDIIAALAASQYGIGAVVTRIARAG